MADSQNSVVQPGFDASSHAKPMQQAVASAVSQATGVSVSHQQLVPALGQNPQVEVSQKPGFDLDLEDIVNRERGKWGNEKSKTFLTRLKEKLLKRFPSQEVKAE